MTRKELIRTSPESVGISSRELLSMLKSLDSCGTEMHGIMIARHGKVIAEGWWAPYTAETVHICHSFGKSYVATAVGAACTQGLLSIEDRIADIFSEDLKQFGVADAGNLAKLRVKHVLTMSNGMTRHPLTGTGLVKNYLTSEMDWEPGSKFMYNTAGSCMLGEIVRRVTGKSVYDYLKETVLDHIGFDPEHFYWMTFGSGLHAAPGVASCTENNLRLGMLYLQDGRWDGRQLIDPEWIRAASSKRIDNERCGYGYQLWMHELPDTFEFNGGHGQISVMSKPLDMAVSINQAASETHDTEAVGRILDQCLLGREWPDALPEDPEALEELTAWLRSRNIPRPESRACHDFVDRWVGRYRVEEGRFHLHPELRTFAEMNLNEDFYTISDPWVHTLEIRKGENGLLLCCNDDPGLEVRLDGQWIPQPAQSAMPAYQYSCAAGVVDDEELTITQWYYQTCFKNRLVFTRDGDLVRLSIRKERLHDDVPYIRLTATLRKE